MPTAKPSRTVPGLGPKAFEQCAGFLRIRGGKNPLDASAIHPESYAVADAVLQYAGVNARDAQEVRHKAISALSARPVTELAEEIGCGVPTLVDILEQLVRPGRDPREDTPAPILRSDVLKMEDLSNGMRLKGTVRNVVDFGTFIDIGVKQDGLLHRTQVPAGDAPAGGRYCGCDHPEGGSRAGEDLAGDGRAEINLLP